MKILKVTLRSSFHSQGICMPFLHCLSAHASLLHGSTSCVLYPSSVSPLFTLPSLRSGSPWGQSCSCCTDLHPCFTSACQATLVKRTDGNLLQLPACQRWGNCNRFPSSYFLSLNLCFLVLWKYLTWSQVFGDPLLCSSTGANPEHPEATQNPFHRSTS